MLPIQPEQVPVSTLSPRYSLRSPSVLSKSLLAGCLSFSWLLFGAVPIVGAQVPNETDEAPSLTTHCQPSQSGEFTNFTQLVSDVSQTTNWFQEPAIGMNSLVTSLTPQLAAYLNASPAPTLHEKARQARVPVMMYHDILPEKKVFFDVTPDEFESHLRQIQAQGLTPISLDQLVIHLRTGLPLPEKPIVLTFDDGYSGHYQYVYPLLKKYGYPATFSIYTAKIGKQLGRSSLTWEQLREMAKDPLVTIASHSLSHPPDLTQFSDDKLRPEIFESKQILEQELGISIHYFTYPEGKYDPRVAQMVAAAGYEAALTMNDTDERFAGQSESLLAISRIGQSRLAEMLPQAWGGPPLVPPTMGFNFSASIEKIQTVINNVPFTFIAGGKPITIHAKSRYQVPEILASSPAIAGVDGGFFSLEFLDSNVMIGPVMSQTTGKFIPGNPGENRKLKGRPLILIGSRSVRFIPFDPDKHNTLEGIRAEMPDVTDAFVGAAFLVEGSQPQPPERFGALFDFNAERHRAFWGINQMGQPQIGVSMEPIGSVNLGIALAKAGFRDAVMLDSGASTSLAYKGTSLVGYTPRPVPHVVGLVPADGASQSANGCVVAQQ
ncbi:MAG: polysaccharide deacetylase family protein [Scytolyngbya sp. HA4215-MV1]|jgi:peptidoglycan/xylan/chitin deacetylase (PgdA/CDA1 family)|nr:polysaccharide deacetylase family protein [Scytolyngbya sp. HA4215-MV1]